MSNHRVTVTDPITELLMKINEKHQELRVLISQLYQMDDVEVNITTPDTTTE